VHACGMIHRDIKPSNIVQGDGGLPRLVDFGLAAYLGSSALRTISGTPPYMAPEQARGQWERIDARTDIYGLGTVLYALLTGVPPHPGANQCAALEHARQGEVKPPREYNRSIPRPLESIVMRALAADPDQRYPSATALRLALRGYRQRHTRRALIALAVVPALALMLWNLRQLEPRPAPSNALPLAAPVPAALTGELVVRVWTPDGKGKQGWSVREPRSLPVLAGEIVRLEARLNQPAYVYLLWLDSKGQVESLYPWNDRHFGQRPPAETKQERVHTPTALDEGLPMRGPGGLETALLLIRRTPLPADTDLAALAGQLPATPLRDLREVAVRGFNEGQPTESLEIEQHRGLGEQAVRIDDALLKLMERLRRQGQFDVIKTVRFAYQGE
jgi:hypothetical protein